MTKDGGKRGFALLVCAVLILSCCSCSSRKSEECAAKSTAQAQETAGDAGQEEIFEDTLKPEVKLPEEVWQDQVMFPGWGNNTEEGTGDNTTYSFSGRQGHGMLYVRCSDRTESFRLNINGHPIDTAPIFKDPSTVFGPGGMINLSPWTVDGENTIQVTDIQPADLAEAVEIYIPLPETPEETQEAQ